MSSPQFPDDPSTPQPPAISPSGQPGGPDAAPASPFGAYPPSGGYPAPGTYPPAPQGMPPGGYPSAPPYYAPPSAPLQPGSYPPPPGYAAPPSAPLPPGYGMPAPASQYGRPAAPPAPEIEPTPAIRQGFLIAGIGGAAALIAFFALPYLTIAGFSATANSITSAYGALWLVPILSALVGVLGFIPTVRNRAYGPMTPRNGAIATMAGSALGVLLVFIVWSQLSGDIQKVNSALSSLSGSSQSMQTALGMGVGLWVMVLGLGAGIVGGVMVFRETQPAGITPTGMMPPGPVGAPPSMPYSGPYSAPPSMPFPPQDPTRQTGAPMPMPPWPSAGETPGDHPYS